MSEFEVVLERQWKLLSVLTTSQEGMTLQELSRLFGVSEKTIKRDLMTLKKVFGPWKSRNEAHGRKRYRYDSQNLTFDEFLDYNELFVIYLGLKMTDALTGTNLGAKAASARQKIETTIREERIKFADCIAPLCRHWGKFTPKICEVVDAVCLAMEKRLLLRVSYRSIRSEADKTYEICPYRFFYRDKSVYLVGLCCYDRKIKFWKLERMSSAEVLEKQRFKIPENFDPDSYVMNGVESVGTPTIRFTGFAARTVPEEHAGRILDIKREKCGAIIVKMDFEKFPTFYNFFNLIMYYGANAEILDPPELRTKFIERAEEMRALYYASGRNPIDYYSRLDAGSPEPEEYLEVESDEEEAPEELEKETVYPLEIEDLSLLGIKRGRGRPRKYPKIEGLPKRRRGRPRKHETIEYLLQQQQAAVAGGAVPAAPAPSEPEQETAQRRSKPTTGAELAVKSKGKKK